MRGFPIRRHTLFTLIFFASGFAGLIYESIWTHYLKLFLGHAAYAQTFVLAVFMGGMAIGAALAGRWVGKLANPLRSYALVELSIGILAISFHVVFVNSTEWLYEAVANGEVSASNFIVLKWALATTLILPASMLLGATFPLFVAGQTRVALGREGFAIASYYFANSMGGALGVLVSGFVAIPVAGLPGTIVMAGLCNLLIAVTVWRLATGQSGSTGTKSEQLPRNGDGLTKLLLGVAFFTGAASFVYEVGWIRMLSLVLGSATHSFELMLSTFILGLALGGLWIRGRIDQSRNVGALLGKVQVVMGVCALATLPLYGLSFDFFAWLLSIVPKTESGYILLNIGRYTISAFIMLPAAFCAGMTLPLITHVLFFHRGQGERSIGAVYSANTIGAIVGVVFAMHVGLPVLGLKFLVAFGAAIDVALGIWLLRTFAREQTVRFGGVAFAGLVIGGGALGLGFQPERLVSGVYRTGDAKLNSSVVAVADGKTATVSLDRLPPSTLVIRTNGKPDASAVTSTIGYADDETTQALIPSIPLTLHPSPRRIANIGFGSGTTSHVLLTDPRVSSLDTIEIEPKMVLLARHFLPLNQRVYEDPRSHIQIDDAKSFFANATAPYDMIISEPSNPWVSGVSGLFSVEFYRHVRRYLAPKGMFVQWIQTYEIDAQRVASILKALSGNFPYYAVFVMDRGNLLLVASAQPINLPTHPLDQLSEETRQVLHRIDVRSNDDLTLRYVGNQNIFNPWLAAHIAPPNSDFYPYLDQHADRDRFMKRGLPAGLFETELSTYRLQRLLGGRLPLQSVGQLTVNSHFGKAPPHLVARAAFLLAWPQAAPGAPLDSDAEHYRVGKRLLDDCRLPPKGDAVSALTPIVGSVLPYLSPEDGREFFSFLSTLNCFTGPEDEDWRVLVSQLISDDIAAGKTAERLLLKGNGQSVARSRYLLGVAMASYLALGDKVAARALWERFVHIAPPQKSGLALQLLVTSLND